MANPQQNITLSAPGFLGLNLEDAPIDMDQRFALEAGNAVIDKFGRLGARKGFKPALVSMPDANASVQSIGRVVDAGVVRYIAAVSSGTTYSIWELTGLGGNIIATEMALPAGYTLDTAKVQIIDFANYGVILTGGEMLLVKEGVLVVASDDPIWVGPQDDSGPAVDYFTPTTGTAAYGRLWLSGGGLGEESIYYCDLNNPYWWYDGRAVPDSSLNTAGVVDVFAAWPRGRDRIIDIEGHNNMLVVFGRNSLLVYGNPQGDPAAQGGIYLADTITNIGLVDSQALVSDGTDLLFVDDTGLRSLGRTIQEQSANIGDLSRTVRTELQQGIAKAVASGGVSLVYDPTHSIVLVLLAGANEVWCFDTRQPSQDGSLRATRWPGAELTCGLYVDETEDLFLGSATQVPLAVYSGALDYTSQAYNFTYSSPVLSFGDPVRTKFLKQIDYTVVSGEQESQAVGSWAYVGTRPYDKEGYFRLLGGDPSYYSSSEFEYGTTAVYGSGATVIRSYRLNTDGSGENVIIKFAATVANSKCSLQQVNIQALIGRIN